NRGCGASGAYWVRDFDDAPRPHPQCGGEQVQFTLIDNCPVPSELAPDIEEIKKLSGASLNSCDRSPEAEPLLKQCGKHSQAQLYEMFKNGVANANPANPPGRSTHERRNDGIAYPGAPGAHLEYWQVGMDWNNPPAAMAAA